MVSQCQRDSPGDHCEVSRTPNQDRGTALDDLRQPRCLRGGCPGDLAGPSWLSKQTTTITPVCCLLWPCRWVSWWARSSPWSLPGPPKGPHPSEMICSFGPSWRSWLAPL